MRCVPGSDGYPVWKDYNDVEENIRFKVDPSEFQFLPYIFIFHHLYGNTSNQERSINLFCSYHLQAQFVVKLPLGTLRTPCVLLKPILEWAIGWNQRSSKQDCSSFVKLLYMFIHFMYHSAIIDNI